MSENLNQTYRQFTEFEDWYSSGGGLTAMTTQDAKERVRLAFDAGKRSGRSEAIRDHDRCMRNGRCGDCICNDRFATVDNEV